MYPSKKKKRETPPGYSKEKENTIPFGIQYSNPPFFVLNPHCQSNLRSIAAVINSVEWSEDEKGSESQSSQPHIWSPSPLSSLPDKNTKILSAMPETHFSVPLGAEMGSFRGPVALESSKPVCYQVIHLHECFRLAVWLKTKGRKLDAKISTLVLNQRMRLACRPSSDTEFYVPAIL